MPSFEFHQPKVFAGIDIDNLSLHAVTVALSCGDGQRTTVLVEAQQLKRLRTAWSMPCTRLGFEIPQGAELRFDNLAYLP
jgi:hypothetical protein